MEELNELMPIATSIAKQEKQRGKHFMILALSGLRSDLDSIHHQILAIPTIPSMEGVFASLLCISSSSIATTENPSTDSSILGSQTANKGGLGGG